MARNRKLQSSGIGVGRVLKALLLCLLLGGSGVGYVWQKDQIIQLGRQIKARETRLTALEDQNGKLRSQLAKMRLPYFIEMRIKELNLGLTEPQAAQKLRLVEPSGEASRPAPERLSAPQLAQSGQTAP